MNLLHQLTGLCHILRLQRFVVFSQFVQVCRQHANDIVTTNQCQLKFPQLQQTLSHASHNAAYHHRRVLHRFNGFPPIPAHFIPVPSPSPVPSQSIRIPTLSYKICIPPYSGKMQSHPYIITAKVTYAAKVSTFNIYDYTAIH